MSTQLYLVPTPIGNLEDITLRALRILKEVDLILAEDTRTTGKLLKHFEISTPQKSYHIHNEHKTLEQIIDLLKGGQTIALVSDAGTPAISDPGYLLVRECLKHDIEIECLPGATAFVPALVKSGFPTDRFTFEGFLPHKKGRQTKIQSFRDEKRTIIVYESPHRLIKALEQFVEFLGEERRISVSRELTKIYEETVTGTAKEVLEFFKQKGVKGEIVIILEANN
ncbi:MAG: 16S rRNA (cytidine(1402)-2'-O)-methyltransferase [bacterium]|nr:16S rRNA (cytidine(1402)-2'-O)-methyltransferase [bacterium]